MTKYNQLRDIDLEGFRLQMWDAGDLDDGTFWRRDKIAYRLTSPAGIVIFEAEDYSPSPTYLIDEDDSVRDLIGFLTLRPGDTYDEYFEDYTKEQLEFALQHGEDLSLYALSDDEADEGDAPAFELPDWEEEETR